MVNTRGRVAYFRGQPRPLSKGAGPQYPTPKFLGPLYVRPNGLTYGDEIWYGNTCVGVACLFLWVQPHPISGVGAPSAPKFFWGLPTFAQTV